MVNIIPGTPNVVAQAPQNKVGADAFTRAPEFVAKSDDAAGIEDLAAGLGNLAVPLAKQQGTQDAASAVTRNPDGTLTISEHPATPILGQAGLAYQQSLETGLIAAGHSVVDQKLAEMATAYQNRPDDFRAAAGAYADGFKANPDAFGLHMADYAQAVGTQHITALIAGKQRSDLASSSAAMEGRVRELEDGLDGLAAQGGGTSPTFAAMVGERNAILAQKVDNPAYGYNQQQRDVDDTNFQNRISVSTFTGAARDEAQRTGNVAAALQTLDDHLRTLSISEPQRIAYEGEVTRHLSAMSAIGAQQRQQLSDQADTLVIQSKAHPESVQPQQFDEMSLQLERSKMFSKSASVQEAKIYQGIISPMIVNGTVADAQAGLHQVQAMAAGTVQGTSGRGLINASYTKPVDQPTASGLSPQTLYSYYLAKGATKNEALLLTGAAGSEGVYNPQAVHDGGIGYGLFGHNGARLDAMRQGAGSFTPSWQQQADFSLKELRSRPEGAAVNSATSADQLTDAQMAYEQPRAYTANNPRAGENYTGRLNTIRYLAQNLKDAPAITPGNEPTGGLPGDPGAPMAMRYSVAVKEAQDAYNKRAEDLWTGIQSAYDNKQQPTPMEIAQIRQLAPDITDPGLRQKISDGLTKAQTMQGVAALPIAQQQDVAATVQALGQQGQLGNIERGYVQTMTAQVAQQANLAREDPVTLARLKTPPIVAKNMGLPSLQSLDASTYDGFVAGLRNLQTWKNVAKADPSVGDMPLRASDISEVTAQAPNWSGQQAANALGAMSTTLKPEELSAVMSNKSMKTMVMGLAHSGDPDKMNAAYSLLDTQYRANPMAFQADDGGKALLELRSWQTLGQFLPPQEVAKRMAQASDPDVIKAKESLEKVADKNLESLNSDNVVRSVYGAHVPVIGTTVPFTSPGDIASPQPAQASGALLADYRSAYSDMYKETGDATAADAFAKEKLGNKYSPSAINGGRIMAYAPDRENPADGTGAYYPKVNGSFDWLKEQLRIDVQQTPYFHDLRIDNSAEAAQVARGNNYALLPDARTQADIAAKRPPSYQVIATGNDGRFHLIQGAGGVPFRFRGDPTAAQAKAAADFTAIRTNAAQVDATPDDQPMGGN